MTAIYNAIIHLAEFEHKKGQTLQQIELHMMSSNIEFKQFKTVGIACSIIGTIAAPFTGGLSLAMTGIGLAVSISSTLGNSTLMTALAKKAQQEIEQLNNINERIQTLCVDWDDVVRTLKNIVIDAGIPAAIRHMLPLTSQEILSKIPKETFTKILIKLKAKITSFLSANLSINFSKQLLKTAIFPFLIGVAVVIDVVDLIRVWTAGDPQALVQIRDIIEKLK